MQKRQAEFAAIFALYIKSKVLLPEEFPGQYAFLIPILGVYGDYWLSHAEVLFEGTEEEACQFYTKGSMVLLYPYLTPQAKEEIKGLLFD